VSARNGHSVAGRPGSLTFASASAAKDTAVTR
jgi:hypothetical protein